MPGSASLVRVETVEVSGDDRNGHRERQHASDGARRANELPGIADRHLVSVADRRHGDDGPPERVRDASDLRAVDAELGVVDDARVDEHADEQDDEEQTELLAAGPHRHYQHLQPDRVFGQLQHPDKPDHAEEGERRARLGAGAAHRRDDVDERHVVRDDRRHVDDVLEVAPEAQLQRRRREPHGDLDGEPGGADGLDDEERVHKVGRLVLDAVRHREGWQRLDAEQHDGDERHYDRHHGHYVRGARRLRVLEEQPQSAEDLVGGQRRLVGSVALGAPVDVDGVRFQLVELEFGEEDVVGDVAGAAQTAAVLVVGEHCLEARTMAVEEQLVAAPVVVAQSAGGVAEQRRRMATEQAGADLEPLAADVDADASPTALARAGAGQQRVVAARTDDLVEMIGARARRRVAGGQRAAVERQRRR